ncbi:Hypothetical protein CINCED_3A020583 [Cinara cedri]|uniref:Uncharacterized protein n=1 Tax=Cinara cedri TaxID=506608 RepID=A0A5E4MDW4_9HEMI|nr:Hypothetical protein CINCED_3A020583 [Cinara cedri]
MRNANIANGAFVSLSLVPAPGICTQVYSVRTAKIPSAVADDVTAYAIWEHYGDDDGGSGAAAAASQSATAAVAVSALPGHPFRFQDRPGVVDPLRAHRDTTTPPPPPP